ncbi:MAG: hypothetical protein DRP22_00640 [Verrucomicrobia bacterium]|nr:MAG: hypothetical protein DRP22_00640 [Verrucomicrobiota bacterium]
MRSHVLAGGGAILLAVMAAGEARAAETHIFTDPTNDMLVGSAAGTYDLTSVEVSRKSSNLIRFVIPLKEKPPKSPADGSGWKFFLDLDDDATTGDDFVKEIGIDLYIVATYSSAHRKWQALTVPRIPQLESTPFTVRQLRVRKKSVKLEILSPAFISHDRWKFVVEAWEGDQCVDRLPNEGAFLFPPGPAAGK